LLRAPYLHMLLKQRSHNNYRDENQQKVVAKSVRHFRLHNERDILLRFQNRTPCIRPLIDELEDSAVPPTLILRYLDDDALRASNKRRLTRPEVKYVAKQVLEALSVLHDEGFVHTGILRLSQVSSMQPY
jgi:serine/threonine protein kinase